MTFRHERPTQSPLYRAVLALVTFRLLGLTEMKMVFFYELNPTVTSRVKIGGREIELRDTALVFLLAWVYLFVLIVATTFFRAQGLYDPPPVSHRAVPSNARDTPTCCYASTNSRHVT